MSSKRSFFTLVGFLVPALIAPLLAPGSLHAATKKNQLSPEEISQQKEIDDLDLKLPLPKTIDLKDLSKPGGCSAIVSRYCDALYSPQYDGNITLASDDYKFTVKQGKTENEFSFAYYDYAKAQLDYQRYLPKDFLHVLRERGMFESLRAFLRRKPRKQMSLAERTENLRLASRLDSIWASAIDETVLLRMEKRFPGYSKLASGLIPFEFLQEKKRTDGILEAEIAVALWRQHPSWKRVERQFELVRGEYIKFVNSDPSLSDDLKKDWTERLQGLKLIIPGSDPTLAMGSCASTEINAYYFTNRNLLTVCAGDFNTEDSIQTLSHEIGHALDMERSLRLFEEKSDLAQRLTALTKASCSVTTPPAFSCEAWDEFKDDYDDLLSDFGKFKTPKRELFSCLQEKKVKSRMGSDYIERVAREESIDEVEWAARNDLFLKLTKPQLPLSDGSMRPNILYMNACRNNPWFDDSDILEEESTLLTFFTSEYRCSTEEAADKKLQKAIDVAKKMQTELIEKRIKNEGMFSSRDRLQADGYATSSDERFADSIGAKVFARILEQKRTVVARRGLYLANVAWQCSRKSLRKMFPLEAKVQKDYYFDTHSEGVWRQHELLLEPIRKALSCEKDFEVKECPF